MSAGDVLKTSIGDVPWSYIWAVWDVLRTLHYEVVRASYCNNLRTSVKDALRMSVGDIPWRLTLHSGTYGDVHKTSFLDVLRT